MLFFLISFCILFLLYGYIGWRIIVPAGLNSPFNIAAWIILFGCMLLPWISIFIRIQGVEGFWSDISGWIGYLSLGFFSLVFTLLVARDLALGTVSGVKSVSSFVYNVRASGPDNSEPADPERRRMLLNSIDIGILGISGILCGYGLYEARRVPRIVPCAIPHRNLPADLDGFRIIQITDIHVGPTIKQDYVQKIVDRVNSLAPDVIVFTGDIADGSVESLRDDVAPLAELTAPYGKYFVTGNHEYYTGVEAWTAEVRRLGFIVLNNEHHLLNVENGKILLAGVTDYTGGSFIRGHDSSPALAIQGAPESNIKILLAHQPLSVFEAAKAGFDLMISGHTHGGQYFPWNHLVGLQQPYVAGFHHHDNTWIYVSRGTGYWGPPLRIGSPSEITAFTLTGTRTV